MKNGNKTRPVSLQTTVNLGVRMRASLVREVICRGQLYYVLHDNGGCATDLFCAIYIKDFIGVVISYEIYETSQKFH